MVGIICAIVCGYSFIFMAIDCGQIVEKSHELVDDVRSFRLTMSEIFKTIERIEKIKENGK